MDPGSKAGMTEESLRTDRPIPLPGQSPRRSRRIGDLRLTAHALPRHSCGGSASFFSRKMK